MNCPNCGKQVPDVSKVCGYCGTKLQTAPLPAPKPAPPAPEPESVPATRMETAQPPESPIRKRSFQLPGWAWGAIGTVLLMGVVLILGLARVVFIPYITPPPEPVTRALSGARLTYHNDFNQLPASKFEYDDRHITLSNGVAVISGNEYDYPYIAYKIDTGVREGRGVLVSFKFTAGAWWHFMFLSGIYDAPEHRAWGVTDAKERFFVKVNEWYGVETMPGNLDLRPNTWYSLLLAVDEGPTFLAVLWESDNPVNMAQIREGFSGDRWEDRGWVFWISGLGGELTIDEITELRFNGIR